ncbi:MAG: hypothetical protein M1828_002242 [Chrysothrix sp. TS-e1954]|nr:MAG: hypothetical protein M1828_002242 [Chrysothrix sp. TS-e1954]
MSFGFGNSGGFGSNNNANNTSSPFGGFGSTANNNNTTTSGFGSTNANANTGFGGGNAGGSLFGNNNNNAPTNTGFGSGGMSAVGHEVVGAEVEMRTSMMRGATEAAAKRILGHDRVSRWLTACFGSTNNQASGGFGTSRPGFGASTATSGGGLFGAGGATTGGFGSTGGGFGSTNNANTTSGFGSTNTSGGLFGNSNQASQTSGGLFGSGSNSTPAPGLFGGNSNTGFNNANTGFAGGAGVSNQNNGTAATPNFQPYTEKEGTGANGSSAFQSITFQPQYQNFSFEELRNVDYNQGRKFGNANGQAGAFGQSTGFGGFGATNNSTTNNTTSGFGGNTGGGLFGQQQQQQNNAPAFGQSNNNTSGFGGTQQSGGLFGQKPATSGGLFGSTPASTTQQSGGLFGTSGGTGGFGSTNNQSGGGLFGAKPFGSTAENSAGGFGATANNNNTFGSNNQQQNTGGGLFGSTQNQGGFGNNTNQPNSSFGGGFGAQNQQSNQPQNTGAFGSTFGANNNQQQKPPSLFGQSNNTGGGLFGSTNNNNQQPNQQSGGLFGSASNQSSGGGLFGSKPAGTGAFGTPQNNNTGGGLFSNLGQNNNQQNQGGGLFGSNNQNQGGGAFGSTSNTGGGGLFGSLGQNNNNNQQQGNSLFGASNNQQQGNSLFGTSQQNQQQQQPQPLNASMLSMNPYGNEPLFASLGQPQQPVGPIATPLSMSKRPPRRQAPLSPRIISPSASSRQITPRNGYSLNYSLSSTPASAYGSSVNRPSLLGGRSSAYGLGKSLSTSNLRESYNSTPPSIFRPDAFKPMSQSYRSSGSMKKLTIDRSLRTTDLFGNGGLNASPLKKNVSFEEEATDGQTNGEANGDSSKALTRVEENGDDRSSATPSAEELGYLRSSRSAANRRVPPPEMEQVRGNELAIVPEEEASRAKSNGSDKPKAQVQSGEDAESARLAMNDQALGEYYMRPSQKELSKMSRPELRNIKNFVVGRHGSGEIQFDEVNLDGFDLDSIPGQIVVFEVRRATVYPDERSKPTTGKGLNVPAQITLNNSWPRVGGGLLPVQETKGPRFERHLKRLKKVSGTEFIDYKVKTGQWIFRVQHFSSYALDYEGNDEGFGSSVLSAPPDTPTPASSRFSPRLARDSQMSNGDVSSNDTSNIDDTFEFRRSRLLPGAFDSDDFLEAEYDLTQSQREMLHDQAQQVVNMEMTETSGFTRADPLRTSEIMNGFTGMDGTNESSEMMETPSRVTSNFQPKSILKASQKNLIDDSTPAKIVMNDDWANQLQRTLSPKKQDRRVLRQTQSQLLDQMDRRVEASPTSKPSQPFTTSVDIMNSLFGKTTGSERKNNASGKDFQWPDPKRTKIDNEDEKMLKSKEVFRTDLNRHWFVSVFHAAVNEVNETVQDDGMANQLAKMAHDSETSPAFLRMFQKTKFTTQFGPPMGRLASGSRSFADFASSIPSATASPSLKAEKTALQLAQILFDSQDSSQSPQETARVRRENLSQFWKSIVTPSALEQARNAKTAEEKAIAYLSADDIWDATEALLNGSDHRLSTMVAQLTSSHPNLPMQTAIAEQISHWRATNTLSEIVPSIRAIYEILAGNTCVSEGKSGAGPENKAETFNISHRFGLSWRQAFGLKLWYGSSPNDSSTDAIVEAVKSYDKNLRGYQERVRPTPWFKDSPDTTPVWQDPHPEDREDILWGLLKIYASHIQKPPQENSTPTTPDEPIKIDILRTLSPESISGNPLDARLSWQLYTLLSASGHESFDDLRHQHQDFLTIKVVGQLSITSPNHPMTADKLLHTLFAAMHFHSGHSRTAAIKKLLSRHAALFPEDSSTFHTLTTKLLIEPSQLHNALATHASSHLHSPRLQIHHLLATKIPHLTTTAHKLLTTTVAPSAVISESLPQLRALLAEFDSSGAIAGFEDWSQGGGIYADFADLMDQREARGHAALQGRRGICARLRRELGGRVERGDMGVTERAAVWEMERVVEEIAEDDEDDGDGDGDGDDAAEGMEGVEGDVQRPRGESQLLKEAMKASEMYYSSLAGAA